MLPKKNKKETNKEKTNKQNSDTVQKTENEQVKQNNEQTVESKQENKQEVENKENKKYNDLDLDLSDIEFSDDDVENVEQKNKKNNNLLNKIENELEINIDKEFDIDLDYDLNNKEKNKEKNKRVITQDNMFNHSEYKNHNPVPDDEKLNEFNTNAIDELRNERRELAERLENDPVFRKKYIDQQNKLREKKDDKKIQDFNLYLDSLENRRKLLEEAEPLDAIASNDAMALNEASNESDDVISLAGSFVGKNPNDLDQKQNNNDNIFKKLHKYGVYINNVNNLHIHFNN